MPAIHAPITAALFSAFIALLFIALFFRLQKQSEQRLSNQIEQLLLLRQLLETFQRHRGLSTGVMNGDASLKTELVDTQHTLLDIEQRILTALPRQSARWQALLSQWHQIRQSVEQTAQLTREQNLLNHHRLIRNTIFLFEDIAADMDLSHLSHADQQAFRVLWHEVPQTAEWLGQARALGTGIAASQSSSPEQRMRLRFLHQKIAQQSAVAFSAQTLHADARLQQSVSEFLTCLEQELLDKEIPQIDARQYFEQATVTINAMLAVLDRALHSLQHDS